RRLEPARTPIRVAADASSYTAASGRATRPPENTISRAVVATRAPRGDGPRPSGGGRADAGRGAPARGESAHPGNAVAGPPPRIVPAPKPAPSGARPARPASRTRGLARPPPPR